MAARPSHCNMLAYAAVPNRDRQQVPVPACAYAGGQRNQKAGFWQALPRHGHEAPGTGTRCLSPFLIRAVCTEYAQHGSAAESLQHVGVRRGPKPGQAASASPCLCIRRWTGFDARVRHRVRTAWRRGQVTRHVGARRGPKPGQAASASPCLCMRRWTAPVITFLRPDTTPPAHNSANRSSAARRPARRLPSLRRSVLPPSKSPRDRCRR